MFYIQNVIKSNQTELEEILEPIKYDYEISWVQKCGFTGFFNSSIFRKLSFCNEKTLNVNMRELFKSNEFLTSYLPIRSGFNYKKHEKTILKNWKANYDYLYNNPDDLPFTFFYNEYE